MCFWGFQFIPQVLDGVGLRPAQVTPHLTGENISVWTLLCGYGHCHVETGKDLPKLLTQSWCGIKIYFIQEQRAYVDKGDHSDRKEYLKSAMSQSDNEHNHNDTPNLRSRQLRVSGKILSQSHFEQALFQCST